jgi:protein polybromo-1
VTKVDMYLGLLRMLKDSETNDGSNRKLAIEFQVLPSRDDYPEYYEIIKRPIDLKTIEERVTKHRYSSAEDLMKDVNTMFANAHSFNEEGSSVYQDATELKALAHTHYLKLLELMHLDKGGIPYSAAAIAVEPERQVAISGGKRRQLKSIKADPTSMCKSILSTLERNAASAGIFGAKAKENLLLFDSLPPRKENPAYYRVVTTPIDLETIRARVDESVYTNPSHIVLDLVLLFNNARVFYDRENAIYLAATGLMQALRLAAAQVLTNQDAMAIPTLDESCPL